jgi:hypothetical protein
MHTAASIRWNRNKNVEATKLDGAIIASAKFPETRLLDQMHTPWDALHRAYFNGEALWTYLTTSFPLTMNGVRGEETELW